MRLATLSGNRIALAIGDEWLDLQCALATLQYDCIIPSTMYDLISRWDEARLSLSDLTQRLTNCDAIRAQLNSQRALIAKQDARFSAPLPDPGTIYAAGMNYQDHLEEMQASRPDSPYMFVKAKSAIVGPGDDIVPPEEYADMVDWEAELAVIIGRTCYRTTPSEALDYVFGYTAANDVSARNWAGTALNSAGGMPTVMEWGRNILGKQFQTFCPLGPSIVTADELADPQDLAISLSINGEVMQQSHTAKMVYSVSEIIAYYSRFVRLEPGDIILTGTMSGVGFGQTPQRFLRDGDRIVVEIERIGALANTFRN